MKGFVNPVRIKADKNGDAPKTIELLRTGSWHTPWHGDFTITTEDLAQFVENASNGVGLVASDPKIPLNYGHASYDKAAGWMASVYLSDDGEALLGDPDWTPAAGEAIAAGEWKYISPEFNPRSWPWEDPEEEHHFVNNVLTGAALTNTPLFKKLKPITASRVTRPVQADASNQEGDHMNIEDIRAKALADLTDEEKTFIDEHKAELTDEERTKFEIAEEAPVEPETPAPAEGGTPVEASALHGITAEEVAQLRADAQAGREAKIELDKSRAGAFVDQHISAGRIKSDQKDATVNMILASRGAARTELEGFIAALPVNALLADEQGHGKEVEDEDVELTPEELELAKDFGNDVEAVKAHKKQELADSKA